MSTKKTIDLNADVGEGLPREQEKALMTVVSSANIACGGHAGDIGSMTETVEIAMATGTRIGAHPSYPDREHFGRVTIDIEAPELLRSLRTQVTDLMNVATGLGARVEYLKPHGALYNDTAIDGPLLQLVLGVGQDLCLPVMLLASTVRSLVKSGTAQHDVDVISEGFIDRAYLPGGRLVPRGEPGAVITNPAVAAAQAVRLANEVDSLCVHSDTADAYALAWAARRALEGDGYTIAPRS